MKTWQVASHRLADNLVRRSPFQRLVPWPALDSEQTGEKSLREFVIVPEIADWKTRDYDKLVVVVAVVAVVVVVGIGGIGLYIHAYSPFPYVTDRERDSLLHHSPFPRWKKALEIFPNEGETGHEETGRGEFAGDVVEREWWGKPSSWTGFDKRKRKGSGMSDLEW